MRRRHKNDYSNGFKERLERSSESTETIEDEKLKECEWADDIRTCSYCCLPLFAIYLYTLHPSVAGGDSGELITTAHELGVAHPPGYPLFTILSKLFLFLIPFKSPAWRVNLMTAIFGALSSFFLQLSVLRLTKSVGVSLLIYPLFSLNKVTWYWSVSAEVFTLNNLFLSLIIITIIYIDSSSSSSPSSVFPKNKTNLKLLMDRLKALSFLCGLSLTNQHTIALHVIGTALWTLHLLYSKAILSVSALCKLLLFFALGLSPYIYLPISSLIGQSRCTWGNQGSTGGFLNHLLRIDYGTFKLMKHGKSSGFESMLMLYLHHVQHKMSELAPWLAIVGVVTCVSWAAVKKHTCTLFIVMATLAYTLLFCALCNLDLHNPLFVGVIERFWMQTDIVVVMVACIGCHTAIRLVVEKFLGSSRLPLTSVLTTMLSVVLLLLQLKNWKACDQSSNRVVNDFGRSILTSMPTGALVLTRGDLSANALRYLHVVQKVRPDLELMDVELMSYPWFIPLMRKFHTTVTFPGHQWSLETGGREDGKVPFNFKDFLDANIKSREIFSCIGMQDKDPSWKSSYEAWPYGVCLSIQPIKGSHFKLNPAHWANRTQQLADKWAYKYDSFDQTSWEKVANDEMWYSKVGTAYYMYKVAMETKDMQYKAQLLIQSYHLYFRAIKMNQAQSRMNHAENFPAFWHKNFALVCERLLHVDPLEGLDKFNLCKTSIFHFEQYTNLEASSTDTSNIVQAVDVLKQRFEYLKKLKKADKSLKKTAQRLDKMEQLSSTMEQHQLPKL